MRDELIVDVGMHRGEDTEFYLAKGFRVIAIEADPRFVADVAQRFSEHINDGRLTVMHSAVAGEPGQIEFFASDEEGWGSVTRSRAGDNLGVAVDSIMVEADTLDSLLKGRGVPYYVKIDIEGADAAAVRAIKDLGACPKYVSWECDLVARDETIALLDHLSDLGYSRFKLVNQSLNSTVRCPYPPREGEYVDAQFSGQMSGPFGEEAPGAWLSASAVKDRYLAVSKQQAARASYAESGRVLGVPVGRFHSHLKAFYNARAIKRLRLSWADWRGHEVGGWFDIHAAR